MKKRVALLAIILGCLFTLVNLNSTSVSADFDEITYEDVEID